MIIFQPELRRSFEKLRHGQLFSHISDDHELRSASIIKQILTAVDALSKQKMGGLIVIELNDKLDEYFESGIPIQAKLTSELLTNLFWTGSPTHDGAVILRKNQILAAGCLLPLTGTKVIDRRLGTRHMAAIGLSEMSDATIIVVSEETGTISIAEAGNLSRYLNREALETRLFSLYKETELPIEDHAFFTKGRQ